jgi:hypothetical protein
MLFYQYRPEFKQRIGRLSSLTQISPHDNPNPDESRTVANSTLFPNDTATLSPFLTPSFCSPRAKRFESRSSASYVRIVRWWCEITLSECVSPLPFSNPISHDPTTHALRSPNLRTTPAKCSGTVCSRSAGYTQPTSHSLAPNSTSSRAWSCGLTYRARPNCIRLCQQSSSITRERKPRCPRASNQRPKHRRHRRDIRREVGAGMARGWSLRFASELSRG